MGYDLIATVTGSEYIVWTVWLDEIILVISQVIVASVIRLALGGEPGQQDSKAKFVYLGLQYEETKPSLVPNDVALPQHVSAALQVFKYDHSWPLALTSSHSHCKKTVILQHIGWTSIWFLPSESSHWNVSWLWMESGLYRSWGEFCNQS